MLNKIAPYVELLELGREDARRLAGVHRREWKVRVSEVTRLLVHSPLWLVNLVVQCRND